MNETPQPDQSASGFSTTRRKMLSSAAAASFLVTTGRKSARAQTAVESNDESAGTKTLVPDDFRISKGRLRQSVMGWCFNPMPVPDLIRHCAEIGIEAIEGIDRKFYPDAQKAGLKISLVSSHGFGTGPVDPKNHASCIEKLREAIDVAVQFQSPSVITFTGMRVDGMDDAAAEENCIRCWKEVVPYAEEKNVTLVLEHLNSRDNSHPMKGHPGYFGDDIERCVRLVERIGSDRFKLLFDIYHVQIMNGDVIRRIRQYHSLIGHYHTAGNPGRKELDATQEINYQAVLDAIVETGYKGFVAQEFIPTWSDPVKSLRHGAMVMDV